MSNNSENKSKSVNRKIPISVAKATKIIVEQIKTNIILIAAGSTPVPINFEGIPGIGKTSMFKDIAKNYKFQTPNEAGEMVDTRVVFEIIPISNFSDEGDVVGMPLPNVVWKAKWLGDKDQKENQRRLIGHKEGLSLLNPIDLDLINKILNEVDDTVIVPSNVVPEPTYLYKNTNVTRTMYAVPPWLPNETVTSNENIIFILVLDDFTRCKEDVRNAIMPLILERKTISYDLPKFSMPFMTSNPNDGNNAVIDMDEAQATRYLTYTVEFDENAWSSWTINNELFATPLYLFLHDNPSLLIHTAVSEQDSSLNPRIWDMINNHCLLDFRKLESIPNTNSTEYNEAKHRIITKINGSVNTSVGAQFNNYLSNNAIYIPPIEDLMENWSDKQVATWMGENIAVSKRNKNLSLSLVVSLKISKYLKEVFTRTGKELHKKPFLRFVRLFWDLNTTPYTTKPKKGASVEVRSLNYLAEVHLVFLAKRIQLLSEGSVDVEGNIIRSTSNKAHDLRQFTYEPDVEKLLTNGAYSGLFEESPFF